MTANTRTIILNHADLDCMTREELIRRAINDKESVRWVRDKKGDSLCVWDIYVPYKQVLGIESPRVMPPRDEALGLCDFYVRNTTQSFPNILLEELEPQNDYYLYQLDENALRREIIKLREVLAKLYCKGDYLDANSYKELFDTLGDKVLYDTRKPDGMWLNCVRFVDCKLRQCEMGMPLNIHEW